MDRRGSKQTLAAAMCKIAGVLVKTLNLSAGVQQETLLLVAADVNVSRSRWLRHILWLMKLQWVEYPVQIQYVQILILLLVF